MSFRKRRGDACELVRQRYWEAQGALVFPVSPNFAGVDLIVFHSDGRVILSEVKGQREPLYGEVKAEAIRKVRAFTEALRSQRCAWTFNVPGAVSEVCGELVHVHGRYVRAGRRSPAVFRESSTETLWEG